MIQNEMFQAGTTKCHEDRKEVTRSLKGKAMARKKILKLFCPWTHIKWKQC
jgi:hypothetical protein